MGLTTILSFFSAIVVIIMIAFPIYSLIKNGRGPRPYKWTWIALGLIIVHWTLFFAGFYTLLPVYIMDALFLPICLSLSIIGGVAALIEINHNKIVGIPLGGLSFISCMFAILLYGVSQM